jgi:hypothetical protein
MPLMIWGSPLYVQRIGIGGVAAASTLDGDWTCRMVTQRTWRGGSAAAASCGRLRHEDRLGFRFALKSCKRSCRGPGTATFTTCDAGRWVSWFAGMI